MLILEFSTAIDLNSMLVVGWYLEHGALTYSRFSDHSLFWLPVTTAAKSASLEIIQLLVSHGAELSKGDVIISAMCSPLADREPVLQYLLEQGAPTNELRFEWNPKVLGLKSHFRRVQGPLHMAVDQDKWWLVKKLVQFGASWDKEDSRGTTPREMANERGRQRLICSHDDTIKLDRPIRSML